MTIPVSHLPRCLATMPGDRYACNCGADSQNERAAMLDRVEAAAHSHRVGDGSLETAPPHGEPDASLEARRAFDAFKAWCEAEVLPRDARWCAVVRAVDASRPGLTLDREALGRLVREVWIDWAREQPAPKASWLVPWEGLTEPDREVDRRIGERIAREAFASRRGLTEEQAREMAREAILGANGGCAIVDRVAAALLRAARGELGPTKPGAQ